MSPPQNGNAPVAGGVHNSGHSGNRECTTATRFIKMPADMDRLRDLGATGLRVLVGLASCADNKNGEARPKLKTLAARTGLSDRHIWRGLKELRASGLVEKLAAGGPGRPTAYRLRFDTSNTDESVSDENDSDSFVSDTGDSDSLTDSSGTHRQDCQGHQLLDFSTRPEILDSGRAPAAAPSLESDSGGQEGKRKSRTPKPLAGDDFATWYAAYPRKVDRHGAEKAWGQVERDRPPLAELLRVLEVQAASHDWCKDGGSYVPYPATYLRHHRWADDPAGYRRSAPSSREPSIRRTAGRSPATPIPGAFDPFAPEEQPS